MFEVFYQKSFAQYYSSVEWIMNNMHHFCTFGFKRFLWDLEDDGYTIIILPFCLRTMQWCGLTVKPHKKILRTALTHDRTQRTRNLGLQFWLVWLLDLLRNKGGGDITVLLNCLVHPVEPIRACDVRTYVRILRTRAFRIFDIDRRVILHSSIAKLIQLSAVSKFD